MNPTSQPDTVLDEILAAGDNVADEFVSEWIRTAADIEDADYCAWRLWIESEPAS